MMRKRAPGLLLCSVGLIGLWGCASSHVKPLTSALFAPADAAPSADSASDSGVKVATEAQLSGNVEDPVKKASVMTSPAPTGPFVDIKPIDALAAGPTTAPSPVAQNNDPGTPPTPVQASAVIGADPVQPIVPAEPKSSAATGGQVDQGVYMTLGGVVAVVNDTPIFANQVLEPLNREFAVKAKDLEEKEFRNFAGQEILRQREELIKDHEYFAIAYHGLSEDDRKLAMAIAMESRAMRVTAAGGSVEQARHEAADNGEDFDESLQKEYRQTVIKLYQHRHVEPLIQVSAQAMRDFYRLNVATRYTDKDKAQFRVIEIDPVAAGGMQPALDKINAIREKAIHGADFTALASADNDDAYLKAHGGSPTDAGEWLERNTYPNEALEAALWQIQAGQITPVVQTNHLLYIAKLKARHDGVVKPFEDPAVQDDIFNRLRQAQLAARSQEAWEDSFDGTLVDRNIDRLQVAMDMAMQRYAQASGR